MSPTIADVIGEFLRSRPGEPWCAACLTRALALRRPYMAIARLEGFRGFLRRYTACTACGKPRFVVVYVGTPENEPPAP